MTRFYIKVVRLNLSDLIETIFIFNGNFVSWDNYIYR